MRPHCLGTGHMPVLSFIVTSRVNVTSPGTSRAKPHCFVLLCWFIGCGICSWAASSQRLLPRHADMLLNSGRANSLHTWFLHMRWRQCGQSAGICVGKTQECCTQMPPNHMAGYNQSMRLSPPHTVAHQATRPGTVQLHTCNIG
eukprot:156595-Chlamydomonas_euryale.AAC.3